MAVNSQDRKKIGEVAQAYVDDAKENDVDINITELERTLTDSERQFDRYYRPEILREVKKLANKAGVKIVTEVIRR